MKRSRIRMALACALSGLCAVASAGSGLARPDSEQVWPRWQARIGWAGETSPLAAATPKSAYSLSGSPAVRGASLLGDYYFATPASIFGRALPLGGLRASGGLVVGSGPAMASALLALPRPGDRVGFGRMSDSTGIAAAGTGPLPYFGIGYTGISTRHGFSLSADLGLLALNPGGTARLGNALGTPAVSEDRLRELRLSPVLQLGVSYAF